MIDSILTRVPIVSIDRKTLEIVEDEVHDNISLEDLVEGKVNEEVVWG